MRRKRSPAQRLAIAEAAGWVCHISGMLIDPVRDKWDLEHVIPLKDGGSDDDDNLRPALRKAHLEKTKKDIKRIAKGKRITAKFKGASKRQGFRGWLKMNGDIVWRDK